MSKLLFHTIKEYKTFRGIQIKNLNISYQIFGKKLHSAPVVLVNHALTGNSDLNSKNKGWWKEIVGDNKLINTKKYSVIAFNIPGNGYDNLFIKNYKDFISKDIAKIFHTVLKELKINKLYAAIGGSVGGGIAWEMACLYPKYIKYLIPVASNYKSSDWIIGHSAVQESILLNSKHPLEDARKTAMFFYRTPASFTKKFNLKKTKENNLFSVESWLNYHGNKLTSRFSVKAYLMVNNLVKTLNIANNKKSEEEILKPIKAKIIQIVINTDLFFTKEENVKTKAILDKLNIKNEFHEIKSIDGHDAFLIEHEQIIRILNPIF